MNKLFQNDELKLCLSIEQISVPKKQKLFCINIIYFYYNK